MASSGNMTHDERLIQEMLSDNEQQMKQHHEEYLQNLQDIEQETKEQHQLLDTKAKERREEAKEVFELKMQRTKRKFQQGLVQVVQDASKKVKLELSTYLKVVYIYQLDPSISQHFYVYQKRENIVLPHKSFSVLELCQGHFRDAFQKKEFHRSRCSPEQYYGNLFFFFLILFGLFFYSSF